MLRDARHAHSEPVLDPTGVGRHVTAHVNELLTAALGRASHVVAGAARGCTTTINGRPPKERPDDLKLRPWLYCKRSKLLGRRSTTVTVTPVPGSNPPAWRAVCDGHNCKRDGIPCACLLHLYPGPLKLEDLHPAALRSTVAGACDGDLPSTPCRGLFLDSLRKDRFGLTPPQRESLPGDIDLLAMTSCPAGSAIGASDSPASDGDDFSDHDGSYTPAPSTPNRGASSDSDGAGASYAELQSAFNTCAGLAGRHPALTRHMLRGLRDLAEDLQEQGERIDDVLRSPSTTCNKH